MVKSDVIKLGVICPAEIAIRRFMPALKSVDNIKFVGVGICGNNERTGGKFYSDDLLKEKRNINISKAKSFTNQYGGKIYESYNDLISSKEIDAVYIPLPPALHYEWTIKALSYGKHVMIEKPSTLSLSDTSDIINLAKSKGLAVHENYMFVYHKQLDAIEKIIESGEIGQVWQYRISFGFPRRDNNDFRYNKNLGGGALFDAGGYVLKYADKLLGHKSKVEAAHINYIDDFDVDIFGTALLINSEGISAQISFGMDNDYKCELEVWGSKGTLYSGRVLTAPVGLKTTAIIRKNGVEKIVDLGADDSFYKSICTFSNCICDNVIRDKEYNELLHQAELVENFKLKANMNYESRNN